MTLQSLPQDIQREVLLKLSYIDVVTQCRSKTFDRICDEKFWRDYVRIHYDILPEYYLKGYSASGMANFIDEILEETFKYKSVSSVDSLKKLLNHVNDNMCIFQQYPGKNIGDKMFYYIFRANGMADKSLITYPLGMDGLIDYYFNYKIDQTSFDTQYHILTSLSTFKEGDEFLKNFIKITSSPMKYYSPNGIITLPFDPILYYGKIIFDNAEAVNIFDDLNNNLEHVLLDVMRNHGMYIYYQYVRDMFTDD